ncbi:MAG: DoxX family membrane protein [Tessaracoccus sp.]
MSTNQGRSGDWVRETTPDDSDWNDDSEYGIAVGGWSTPSPTPADPPPSADHEDSPAIRDDVSSDENQESPAQAVEQPGEEPESQPQPTTEEPAAVRVEESEPTTDLSSLQGESQVYKDQPRPRPTVPTVWVEQGASPEASATSSPVNASGFEEEEVPLSGASFGRPVSQPIGAPVSAASPTDESAVSATAPTAPSPVAVDEAVSVRVPEPQTSGDPDEETAVASTAAIEEQPDTPAAVTSAPVSVVSVEEESHPAPVAPRQVTDKFLGSFGLFVLRIVVAGIVGVVGYQVLSDIDATSAFLATTLLPEPRVMAWVLGCLLCAVAGLLILGLLVRVAALLLLVAAVGSLLFIRWGAFSIFVSGIEGFLGDRDLLLAAVALVLLCLGGGRWGLDGAVRGMRERAREGYPY